MERHAQWLAVLVFLLLCGAGFIGFSYWMEKLDQAPKQEYSIHVAGTVSGLSVGSEVKYLGVPIGRVTAIRLSDSDTGVVEVDIGVKQPLPSYDTLIALLEPLGITGLSIVELQERSEEMPGFATPEGVIPGYPSVLIDMSNSARILSAKAEHTLDRINQLLDQKLVEDIGATVSQLRQLSENLNRSSAQLEGFIAESRALVQSVRDSMPAIQSIASGVNEDVLPAVVASTRSLQQTSDQLATLLQDNAAGTGRLIQEDIPSVLALSDELAITLQELRRTLAAVNADPGALLYGESVSEVEIPIE